MGRLLPPPGVRLACKGDGTANSVVSAGASAGFAGVSAFSVWIYKPSATVIDGVLEITDGTVSNRFSCHMYLGQVAVHLDRGGTNYVNQLIGAVGQWIGNWHIVCVTTSGSSITVWVDGGIAYTASGSFSFTPGSTPTVSFNGEPLTTYYSSGRTGTVGLYTSLTQADVTALYSGQLPATRSGHIESWVMADDAASPTLAGTNGHAATKGSTTTMFLANLRQAITSNVKAALMGNGTASCLVPCGALAAYAGVSAASIWCYVVPNTESEFFEVSDGSVNNQFGLYLHTGLLYAYLARGGSFIVYTSIGAANQYAGALNNFAVTASAAGFTVWVNSVQVYTTSTDSHLTLGSTPTVSILGGSAAALYLTGWAAQFGIYTALSAADALALTQGQAPSTRAGFISSWACNEAGGNVCYVTGAGNNATLGTTTKRVLPAGRLLPPPLEQGFCALVGDGTANSIVSAGSSAGYATVGACSFEFNTSTLTGGCFYFGDGTTSNYILIGSLSGYMMIQMQRSSVVVLNQLSLGAVNAYQGSSFILACTWGAGGLTLWINGAQVYTTATDLHIVQGSTPTIEFCGENVIGYAYNGLIANPAIYTSLTASDALALAQGADPSTRSGFIAEWRCNEGSGAVARVTGAGNNASLGTTTAWKTLQGRPFYSSGRQVGPQLLQNLFTYSDDVHNAAWMTYYQSVTANNAINPVTGLRTAALVTDTSDGSPQPHFFGMTPTISDGPYAFSVIVKSNTLQWFMLSSATGAAYFDIINGLIGNVVNGATNASIVPIGNGWFECFVVIYSGVGAGPLDVYMTTSNGGVNYQGSASLSYWVAHVQLNQGNAVSQYCKTTSAVINTGAPYSNL